MKIVNQTHSYRKYYESEQVMQAGPLTSTKASEGFYDPALNRYLHAYELDEKLYDIAFLQNDEIVVKGLLRRDFPRCVVSSHVNNLLNKGIINDFDCFYTGVRCWKATFDISQYNPEHYFCLTKDHASPLLIARDNGNSSANLVLCSGYANAKLGHISLAMKLWIRRKLMLETYSRESRTAETIRALRTAFIKFNNMFQDENGLYIYQPWTYTDPIKQKKSQRFYDKITEVDHEFLRIKSLRAANEWLRSYDPSWFEALRLR